MREHVRRITNRYAEAAGHNFDKIPQKRLILERDIADIEREIKTATGTSDADKNLRARLGALLIRRKRELEALGP